MLLFQLFWWFFWLLDLFLDCCRDHFSDSFCFMFFTVSIVCMYVRVKQRKEVLKFELIDRMLFSFLLNPSISFFLFLILFLFPVVLSFFFFRYFFVFKVHSIVILFLLSTLSMPCTLLKLRLCLILFMLKSNYKMVMIAIN